MQKYCPYRNNTLYLLLCLTFSDDPLNEKCVISALLALRPCTFDKVLFCSSLRGKKELKGEIPLQWYTVSEHSDVTQAAES